MATGTSYRTGDSPGTEGTPGDAYPVRQPSRWLRNLVLIALVMLALLLAFSWRGLRQEAMVSTSYGAQVACACRFVSRQELGTCKSRVALAGLGRTASLLSLSEDAETRTVTASVPLLASQTASFAPDRGCQLEAWAN